MAVITPYNGYRTGIKGIPNGTVRKVGRGRSMRPKRVSSSRSPSIARSIASTILPLAAGTVGGPAGAVAAGAMEMLLDRMFTSTATQMEDPAKRKRYGAGRWVGYVKRKRVKRKKLTRKRVNNSYMLSVEKSGTQTPSVSAVVGHSTISRTYGVRAMFGALLRFILYRIGVKASSPSNNITPMVTGTVIGIEFQYAAATNDGFSITVTAPITFTALLDAFINAWNTKYDSISAGLAPYDIRFRNIYISGTNTNPVMLDLVNAKINLWCSSRFKMQNRSLNTPGDDDADDVDNVPINCLSYQGFGTGLDSRYDFLGLGFCANQDCIIQTSDPPLAGDAPLPALLQGVKKAGFHRLQPGNIKTDVLKHKVLMSLDNFTRYFLGPRGNGNLRLPIGKFSFIHYEKTMEANNASPVAMNIAFENQLYINAKILATNRDIPIPEFFRS